MARPDVANKTVPGGEAARAVMPVAWASAGAWREVVKRVGVEDFRWHDRQHTWAR
jgi:hypothetical protein